MTHLFINYFDSFKYLLKDSLDVNIFFKTEQKPNPYTSKQIQFKSL